MNRTCVFQRIRLSPRCSINILLRQMSASHFSRPLHLFFYTFHLAPYPQSLGLLHTLYYDVPPPPHRDAQRTCNSVRNASLHSRSVLDFPCCVRLAPHHRTVVRRAKNEMVGLGPLAMHCRKVEQWGARRTELLRTTRGADIASGPIFCNASLPCNAPTLCFFTRGVAKHHISLAQVHLKWCGARMHLRSPSVQRTKKR